MNRRASNLGNQRIKNLETTAQFSFCKKSFPFLDSRGSEHSQASEQRSYEPRKSPAGRGWGLGKGREILKSWI